MDFTLGRIVQIESRFERNSSGDMSIWSDYGERYVDELPLAISPRNFQPLIQIWYNRLLLRSEMELQTTPRK